MGSWKPKRRTTLRLKVALALRLRLWAKRLDPTTAPYGIVRHDMKAGQLLTPDDFLTQGQTTLRLGSFPERRFDRPGWSRRG